MYTGLYFDKRMELIDEQWNLFILWLPVYFEDEVL
jgi:hypothetical protein